MSRFIEEQHFAFKIVLFLYGAHLTVREKVKDVTLLEGVFTDDETKKFSNCLWELTAIGKEQDRFGIIFENNKR